MKVGISVKPRKTSGSLAANPIKLAWQFGMTALMFAGALQLQNTRRASGENNTGGDPREQAHHYTVVQYFDVAIDCLVVGGVHDDDNDGSQLGSGLGEDEDVGDDVHSNDDEVTYDIM